MGKKETREVPRYDMRYLCDDGVVRTWEDLTKDLETETYSSSQEDFGTLMFCFGAEEISA